MATVFFVDDDGAMRVLVRAGIERHGEHSETEHVIHEEESFDGAIAFINQVKEINLAIIDGSITNRNDGIQVARHLRERFPNALIISHSAETRDWRLGEGYRDYPKPMIFSEFIELLDEMFASTT